MLSPSFAPLYPVRFAMLEKSVEVPFDEMLDSFVPGEDLGDIPFAALFNNIPQVGDREVDTLNTVVRF